MTGKTWAIGDLHGHFLEMMALVKTIKKAGADFNKDTFIFLGDVVDGGPDTKKVINQLIKWTKQYKNVIVLYGNHESLMLDALRHGKVYNDFNLWFSQGGKATIDSYKMIPYINGFNDYERALTPPEKVIPKKHLEWLAKRPTWYEDEKYFYVHGGVHAYHTIEWAKKNWSQYNMIWERDFIPSKMKYEKKVIFGHTPTKEPIVKENKIGIDTMYQRNAGRLCALELPAEKFWFQEMLIKPSF